MIERTIGERLSVVEEQVSEIKISQEKENQDIAKLLESVKELQNQLEKYKGFLGGIVFVVMCVVSFIKTWPYISGFFNK